MKSTSTLIQADGRTLLRAALVGLVVLAGATAAPAQRSRSLGTPSITVAGTGKVAAKPDMAIVNVGVLTRGAPAIDALQANNAAVERLFHVLDTHDIVEKDRQTTNFSVIPRVARRQKPQEVTVYEVRNQVQIKVRSLQALGPLLDELVGEGANQLSGIRFDVAESAALLDDARQKAIEDARRKAALYAQATGLTLGRVISVNEQGVGVPGPVRWGVGAREMSSAVPVASGEQEFSASEPSPLSSR